MQNLKSRIENLEQKTRSSGVMVFHRISNTDEIIQNEKKYYIQENEKRTFYIGGKEVPKSDLAGAKIILDSIDYEVRKLSIPDLQRMAYEDDFEPIKGKTLRQNID